MCAMTLPKSSLARRPSPNGRYLRHESILNWTVSMSLLVELFAFAKARKKFWLGPLLLPLGLLVLAKGSAVAPFIYTIF